MSGGSNTDPGGAHQTPYGEAGESLAVVVSWVTVDAVDVIDARPTSTLPLWGVLNHERWPVTRKYAALPGVVGPYQVR